MDIFVLKRICEELKEIILGRTIRSLLALPDNTIALELNMKRDSFYLVISGSSQFPRIHIDSEVLIPPIKSSFSNTCQIHLEGSKISSISSIEGERILEIVFEKPTLWGEIERRSLMVEIMGKHSNIILCKDQVIIDAIKRIDASKSRARQVLPGLLYQYPPKKSSLLISELHNYISSSEITLEEFLIKNITGIGQLSIMEILSLADLSRDKIISSLSEKEVEDFKKALKIFQERLKDVNPVVYVDENGNPESYYLFPLTFKGNNYERYNLLVTAATRYYDWIVPSSLLENRKKSLIKELEHQMDVLLKRKEELKGTILRLEDYDRWKLYGDVILAYKDRIEEKADRFMVDWEGKELEVPLDPTKTVIENAQEYYKRYKKAKKEKEVLPDIIGKIDKEIESLRKKILRIDSIKSLEELKEEKKTQEKAETSLPYIEYDFKGYKIWVGRNARSNELITFKLSSPSDIWLHAKGYGGSHVIIRTNGKNLDNIPREVLLEAAKLAALHSKGRSGGKVLVDYTLRKYVKSGGKRAGNVFYTNYKTIVV
ncbi:MAG: Rqc2 family fibronectin-binding protein [bacterium]